MVLDLLDLHNLHKDFITTQNVFISTVTISEGNKRSDIPVSKCLVYLQAFQKKID